MTDIMRPEDVAEFLKISKSTLYRWAERGEIPAFKLGGAWRFQKVALEKWIDQLERKGRWLP